MRKWRVQSILPLFNKSPGRDPQLDGELYLAQGFMVPPNSDFAGYHSYVDENLPPESPVLYGLHPNAEIEFLTTLSENLFRTVFEMQPRDAGAGAGGGVSREEKVICLAFCDVPALI